LTSGGNDRLVDALVAWGDETKRRARVEALYKVARITAALLEWRHILMKQASKLLAAYSKPTNIVQTIVTAG
jgi:hypothetical protein